MTKKNKLTYTLTGEGEYKEPHIPKIKTDQGLAKSLDEFHGETGGSETTFLDRKLRITHNSKKYIPRYVEISQV